MNPPPPLPTQLPPPAFGQDPYEAQLYSKPPPPPVDLAYLAFGETSLLQDPRYRASNLPPFRP